MVIGLAVMILPSVAAVLRVFMDAAPSATIRLFEAFISYKKAGARLDHKQEASMLRNVVMRSREPICIVSGDPLKSCPDDELCRRLATVAPNERIAACQLGLANLFLQMSGDLRRMELTATAGQSGTNTPQRRQRAGARGGPGSSLTGAPVAPSERRGPLRRVRPA